MVKSDSRKNIFARILPRVPVILVAFGLGLRLWAYLGNGSFSSDEAWLALSLAERSLSDIFLNANLNPQISLPPVGFLIIEKYLLEGFIYNEYVCRLFPFVSGCLGLLLYHNFLKNNFDYFVHVCALALFALTGSLIYYSVTLKQYSSDVLSTIVLCFAAWMMGSRPLKFKEIVLLSLSGMVCVSVSHPAIFIALGFGLVSIMRFMKFRNDGKEGKQLLVYSCWVLFFVAIFWTHYRAIFANGRLVSYQEQHFLSLTQLRDAGEKLLAVLQNPGGMLYHQFGVGIFLIGAAALLRKNRMIFIRLGLPLFITFFAAVLQKYPFQGRFLLFLLPVIFIFLAEGFYALYRLGAVGRISALVLFFVFFGQSLWQTSYSLVRPVSQGEIKPVVAYLRKHQQPGDTMYINNNAQFAFRYYVGELALSFVPQTMGIFDDRLRSDEQGPFTYVYHTRHHFDSRLYDNAELLPGRVRPDSHSLNRLECGGRVWLLFSQSEEEAREHVVNVFDQMGIRKEALGFHGSYLYLYRCP